jgi:hypothetical protein
MKVLLLVTAALGLTFGQNLLVNGDFEQELAVGWVQDTAGYGYKTFGRDTAYQPDPDFEALDSLYSGNGISKLGQIVDVPGPALHLSFSANFGIGGGSSTCWPVACVAVGYLDSDGNRLGETRFYYHDSYCTWTPTSTFSLIEVTDPAWNQYELDVADELSLHLPGVDPGDVSRVEVALLDTTAGG